MNYPYLKDIDYSLKQIKSSAEKRFDIVAEQASEFIKKLVEDKVIKSMSNVIMSGFSFGAHIAAYTCRILEKTFKRKVKALFGRFHFVLWINYYFF